MRIKIAVALSGGMDSTTLLGKIFEDSKTAMKTGTIIGLSTFDQARLAGEIKTKEFLPESVDGIDIYAVNFYYGSKHNDREQVALKEIFDHYKKRASVEKNITLTLVKEDLTGLFNTFDTTSSTLLKNGKDIPEVHYEDAQTRTTVVPGRNSIMLSVMLGLIESHLPIGTEDRGIIAFGPHMGDHAQFPDCREDYTEAINKAFLESSDGRVVLITPYISWRVNKIGILKLGTALHVPYEKTWTCYKGGEKACGKCPSCIERLEAFNTLGLKDPIEYE